jgi:hypothetical protein
MRARAGLTRNVSSSPFCSKLDAYLRIAKIKHTRRTANFQKGSGLRVVGWSLRWLLCSPEGQDPVHRAWGHVHGGLDFCDQVRCRAARC